MEIEKAFKIIGSSVLILGIVVGIISIITNYYVWNISSMLVTNSIVGLCAMSLYILKEKG